jgi:uncharacterized membrane protein YgdD (TMEM256/DUF423 family)
MPAISEPERLLVATPGVEAGRRALLTGILVCGLAVGLGAFGAHALEGALTDWYPADQAQGKLSAWETGVRYQLVHGLAIICFGIWQSLPLSSTVPRRTRAIPVTFWSFATGILLFSGDLYLWVLTAWKPFVMLVPAGGVCFLAGWLGFFAAAFQREWNRS